MVVTTVPAKKKLLPKSQLLGLVELPLGFTPFTQASMMTCGGQHGVEEQGKRHWLLSQLSAGAFLSSHSTTFLVSFPFCVKGNGGSE